MKKTLLVLVIALALVWLLFFSQQRSTEFVVSGFIESDEIRVGSRVGGRIAKVLVEEGQPVSKDDVLIELEPFDLLERRAEAEQVLAQAVAVQDKLVAGFRDEEIAQAKARRDEAAAALEKLQNGPRPQEIATSEAQLQLIRAKLELATTVYQRVEKLFGREAADRSALDEAETSLSVARSEVAAQTERLALLKEGSRQEDIASGEARVEEAAQQLLLMQNGIRPEEIREAIARRDGAQASLDAIQRQIDELKITAPCDAIVEAIELRPGDLLSPNAPAVSLADVRRIWVRAYVPENRLDLSIGKPVRLRVDSFPGRTFSGDVSFVARNAEFTPGNVQTPEERSKQVFRIKVQVTDGLEVLRPGMSADVILSDESTES